MIGIVEIALIFIAAVVALYLVASPRYGERIYHSALFAPWKYPIGSYDGTLVRSGRCEDIFFDAIDGKKLHGWFFQGTKSTTILVSHGKTGNLTDIERLLHLLLETGASIFVYDYRGFGRSEGSPSLKVICEDGISAYNWLTKTKRTSPNKIVAYGESLGGVVACHLANNVEIAGLILQSAFSSLRIISIENVSALRFFPQFLFPIYGRNEISVANFKKPVLVIHGKLDEDIVIDHSHRIHAAASEEKELVVLPNTLHDEIAEQDSQAFIDSVVAFLSKIDNTEIVSDGSKQSTSRALPQK